MIEDKMSEEKKIEDLLKLKNYSSSVTNLTNIALTWSVRTL